MICDVNSYYDYLTINYNNLKEKIKRILFLENIKFDEDIFHTTLCNCHNLFMNNSLSFFNENNLEAYLYNSVKINIFRDKKYASNKYNFTIINENDLKSDNDMNYFCDLNIIMESIKNEFGEVLSIAYYDNINGESISSLQNKLDIKNLKQKIKNIKKYINDKKRESFI